MTVDYVIKIGLFQPLETTPRPAGLLKINRDGLHEYGTLTYGTKYFVPGHIRFHPDESLSPQSLELPPARIRNGGAMPPYIKDSLPDAWGKLVLASYNQGRALDDYEILCQTNKNRVGALVVMDPEHAALADISVGLSELFDAAMNIQYGFDVPLDVRRLLEQGGTLGGARPKASIVEDSGLWIAKFAMREDRFDCQAVEAASLQMAKECGIRVPDFRTETINGKTVLLIRRFDRQYSDRGEHRIHFLSGAGLLNVTYESGLGSYVEIANAITRFGAAPAADCRELFKRMLFNILIDNTDDHIKNHGVLHLDDNKYRLSPAFDVLPQGTALQYMGLPLVGQNNHPTLRDLLAAADFFHLRPSDALAVFSELLTYIVSHWRDIFAAAGVVDRDLRTLERTLVPLHQKWTNELQAQTS